MTQTGDIFFTPPGEADMPVIPEWLYRGANAFAVHSLFHTMNVLNQMRHRDSERYLQVEVMRDVDYGTGQRLDIWRPVVEHDRALPVMLFVHGGGFRTMSKRTHWFFARTFARMGFVVCSVDYRMGRAHRFPEPLEDVATAFEWVCDHIESHGGDLSRLVFAGESAGANLILALTALCTREPDASQGYPEWARRVYEREVVPTAILPMCGVLQVSDPERHRRRGVSALVMGPLVDAHTSYLGDDEALVSGGFRELADPLCVFESHLGEGNWRTLPEMMLNVGGLDPLVDDSERLARVWPKSKVKMRTYKWSGHSFMAFMWMSNAQQCWSDMADFLRDSHVLEDHYSERKLLAS